MFEKSDQPLHLADWYVPEGCLALSKKSDYKKDPNTVFVIGEKIEETPTPSCETCKYKGFEVMGADSPCFGCVVTEDNFKMYEPKEDQE